MQPREKFQKYWAQKLESRELIAILLGSGSKGINVFTLSKKVAKILGTIGPDISAQDIQNIKGMGPAKTMQIMSAFALAKRHFIKDRQLITWSKDILPIVAERRNKKQEHLICITLDGAHRVITPHLVTIGTLTQSLVHPREIFAPAIEERAHSIILVHNHPSGTLVPSNQDKAITQKIQKAWEIIGIHLLDHLIITKASYRSFKEHNLL